MTYETGTRPTRFQILPSLRKNVNGKLFSRHDGSFEIVSAESTPRGLADALRFYFSARALYFPFMPILGHGIDIVETERIRRLIEHHGEHFLNRVYTPIEQEYANRSQKRRIEHLAGRFAAKEAVLKVLGTGWRGGIAWTDIEIRPEPSGQPRVYLTGECARIAAELGICRWHMSISHIETHATASAIGLRAEVIL